MNKLEITKENYIGYTELYRSNNFLTRKEFMKWLGLTFLVCGAICGLEIGLIFNYISVPVNCLIFFASIIVGNSVMSNFIANRNFKKTKKKYPYIENYDNYTVRSALEEVKILCNEKVNGVSIQKINVKNYEDRLKMDDIKEELFNDSEYKYSSLNDFCSMDEEVKEKTKVKVKKYMNRGRL